MERKRLHTFAMAFILLANLLTISRAWALINQPDEESLRAAMIIGILRYTTLPIPEKMQLIQVCSIGKPIAETKLNQVISGLRINGRNLKLNIIKSNKQNIAYCHVVIQGPAYQPDNKFKIPKKVNQLTVCDGCKGGMGYSIIELVNLDNRIGFKVNLHFAQQNKIKFSSSLLELASELKGKQQ